MRELGELRAVVVGSGFVCVVHVDALRRLGVEIAGVVGSSPARARSKGLAPFYDSLADALADDRVDVVHFATPNQLHCEQASPSARVSSTART
jgi:predicted dehydrogenase